MRPCTRRIASTEKIIKATSLNDLLVEHAPWCRTAPNALPTHTNPLAPARHGTPRGAKRERPGGDEDDGATRRRVGVVRDADARDHGAEPECHRQRERRPQAPGDPVG